jgi:hypothetical protein
MKIIIAAFITFTLFGTSGCTFVATASGGAKYNEVKRTPGPKQVPAERQTHRKFGKNPKPRPHDN